MTTFEVPDLTDLLLSWQFVAGALVLTVGPLLLARRWRSSRPSYGAKAAGSRGRRAEDLSTMLVAAVAAYLSANGLRRVGEHLMHLAPPADFLPFVGLDLAAMVCGRRARRSAQAGHGPGLSGVLFWTLAAVSSFFSATEADSILGAALRAVWPLLAAVLWEIGSLEERRAARAAAGRRPARRLAVTRLFSPAESIRVSRLLAANTTMSEEEATHTDRVRRAVDAWYDLRTAQTMTRSAGRRTRWLYSRREARADIRAFQRSSIAGCHDIDTLTAVAAGMQMRTQLASWVQLSFKDEQAFNRIRDSRIGMTAPVNATPPAPEASSSRQTGIPSAHPSASHPGNGGTPEDAPSQQVSPSTSDPEASSGKTTPTKDNQGVQAEEEVSDETLQRWLLHHAAWDDEGKIIWGINKIARMLGIGNPRATRLRDTQTTWAPELRRTIGITEPTDRPGTTPADQAASPTRSPATVDATALLDHVALHVPSPPTQRHYIPLPTSGLLVPAGHAPVGD
nr:hypothetical protein KPHV_85000 [Kitasatospora purpeofusca]